MMRKLAPWAALLGTIACSNSLAPYGEVIFSVDTDMAIPRFVDSLRVDTFAANGTWIDSHEYAVFNARDWPLSFGIYSEDLEHDTTVYVRLRAYTATRTRDYRGERYADESGNEPGPIPATTALQLPRLVQNGLDVTPTAEPEPISTIDRVVEVILKHGEVNNVAVVLKGDCVGTMAAISAGDSYSAFDGPGARSCIDTATARVPLAHLKYTNDKPGLSVQGTWNPVTKCDQTPAGICVPGGAFFIGGYDSVGWDIPATPQRIIALSPFAMDANETTVGAWRAAVAKGFKSPDETPWPLDHDFVDTDSIWCTYTTAPGNRESFPLNCISVAAARAYCQFAGGDLPTEAQWEYAASAAGRDSEARFPWGDSLTTTCAEAVVLRSTTCSSLGKGPQTSNAATAAGEDVTPLGLMNMAGSLTEWVRGAGMPYTDPCWQKGPKDPLCDVQGSPVARGGNWGSDMTPLSDRVPADYYNAEAGFRCVYKGTK